MRVRRAPVVWKKEGGRVFIMARAGVFLLNEKAAQLWESFDGGEIEPETTDEFIKELAKAGLVEVEDD